MPTTTAIAQPKGGEKVLEQAKAVDRAGDSAKALELYRQYLKSATASTAAEKADLGLVHLRVAILLLEDGSQDEALVHLNKSVALVPGLRQARFARAMLHFRAARFKTALKDLDLLLSGEDAKDARHIVWYTRGLVRFQLEQFDGAIADMSKAIEDRPDLPNAYRYRGLAYAIKRNFAPALKDLGEAIDLTSRAERLAVLYTDRGTIYARQRNYDAAIKEFDEALRNDGRYFLAWHGRGRAQLEKGLYREAESDLEAATRLQPRFTAAWRYLGRARFILGRFTESAEAFEELVRLAPKDVYASLWKHIATSRAGSKSDALDSFLKATGREAAAKGAWPYHAIALYKGKTTAAAFRRFITTGKPPLRAEAACAAHLHLSQYHLIAGKDPKAARAALTLLGKGRNQHFAACHAVRAELSRLRK